jgi:TonB family protein
MAAGEKGREPRAASLLVSVTFHALAGLGVVAGSWWWGPPTLEAWKTQTVFLVDAPLSLQPTAALSQAAPSKVPHPPEEKAKAPAAPASKAPVKAPAPSRKPEVAKPQAKTPARAKPAPAKPAQTPQAISSHEARSAIEALRQRQARREQERQQAEDARRQAASARVAALRDALKEQEAVGNTAVTAAGVQRVRLVAYQDRVRTKIIETWILPLSAEQTRDLQATAQFQVTRSGHVVQLELVKPSGNTLFDASLLRAIRRASPLPALPEDYPLDVLEVEMRFRAGS